MSLDLLVWVLVAWSFAVLGRRYLPAALRARLLAASCGALAACAGRIPGPRAARLVAALRARRSAAAAFVPAAGCGTACGGCKPAAADGAAGSISVDALRRTARR